MTSRMLIGLILVSMSVAQTKPTKTEFKTQKQAAQQAAKERQAQLDHQSAPMQDFKDQCFSATTMLLHRDVMWFTDGRDVHFSVAGFIHNECPMQLVVNEYVTFYNELGERISEQQGETLVDSRTAIFKLTIKASWAGSVEGFVRTEGITKALINFRITPLNSPVKP